MIFDHFPFEQTSQRQENFFSKKLSIQNVFVRNSKQRLEPFAIKLFTALTNSKQL